MSVSTVLKVPPRGWTLAIISTPRGWSSTGRHTEVSAHSSKPVTTSPLWSPSIPESRTSATPVE